jgi:SagB-type dehydrogenase family enzyme
MNRSFLTLPFVFVMFLSAYINVNDDEYIALPAPQFTGKLSLEEALQKRRSIRSYSDQPVSLTEVGQLLWAGQGITEKSRGLRTAPSAGATYPMELYLIAGNVEGLTPGVYRYQSATHSLQLLFSGDIRKDLSAAALQQPSIIQAPATILITGILSRTSQRYGQRAQRYVHMEAGHISQNIFLQATAIDIATVVIGAFQDISISKIIKLGTEESPLYLMPFGKHLK